MKRLLIFTIILLNICNIAFCEEIFHASRLYQCTGPVKEIKYSTPHAILNYLFKVKFDKDGKIKRNPFMEYNSLGLPTGYRMDEGDITVIRLSAEYNDNQMPDTVIYESNMKNKKFSFTFLINYITPNIADHCRIIIENNNGRSEYMLKYSDYVFDSHNNWIERSVKISRNEDDPTSNITESSEKRKISYY